MSIVAFNWVLKSYKKHPMASFLTTPEISENLLKIILDAKKNVVLVSPYLKISMPVFKAMKKSADRGIKIRLIYKVGKMDANARQILSNVSQLETYALINLHSKCYLNERAMIITSMNLYEKMQTASKEMGILLDRETDAIAFKKALEECKSIWQASKIMPLERNNSKSNFDNKMQLAVFNSNLLKEKTGYCIRCNTSINYEPEKPFCYDCYSIWSEFRNPYYEENFCHSCGSISNTDKSKPECYACFESLKQNRKINN